MSSQTDKVYTPGSEIDPLNVKIQQDYLEKRRYFNKQARNSFILHGEVEEESIDQDELVFQESLDRIEREDEMKRRAASKNLMNPHFWRYLISKNLDLFAITLMELNSLLLTYPLLTIKTRVQSKNIFEDSSHFIKNKVANHSMYAGISQGLASVFVGNAISISTFRLAYSSQTKGLKLKSPLDISWVNLKSHAVADIVSLPFRHIFDVRRINAQMNSPDKSLTTFFKAYYRSMPSCLVRDLIFRVMYNLSNQITLYGKFYYYYYRYNPGSVDINDYERRLTMNHRLFSMLFSTLIAGFLSNPFDVVTTKLVAQSYDKYTGPIDCFKTVMKEETPAKLFFSGFSSRCGFYGVNGFIVLMYYGSLRDMMEEAYSA